MDSSGGNAALNWYSSDRVVLALGGGNVSIGINSGTDKLNVAGSIGIGGTTVIDSSRNLTNIGTVSSGSITATDTYGGGSGDYTNITTPQLKIVAEGGGYWRIPHISGNSTISGVYNYEDTKDVYWGEPNDSGLYRFRGRNLRIEGGSLQIGTTAIVDQSRNFTNVTSLATTTAQARVKLSVWSGSLYGIGMGTGYTFGGINNDYVMSHQMNNDDDRGFWWGDQSHTNAQGAMALTTDGYLTVARGMRVGYGESDTTHPSAGLDVSGTITTGAITTSGDFVMTKSQPYVVIQNTTEDNGGIVFNDYQAGAWPAASSQQFRITYNSSAQSLVMGHDHDSYAGFSFGFGGALTCSGNVTAFSDERLKENIKTLDSKKALQMRGVSFTKDGIKGSGVIAQEIEEIAPELVITANDEIGTKSVAYGNLVGYLIEAIKDQQKQIDELKARLDNDSSK
jgi:hypothetical protein